MVKETKPEVISLTQVEVDALKERVLKGELTQSDQHIVIASLTFNFWLQNQLSRAQLTILRLKKIFGFSTEKKRLK